MTAWGAATIGAVCGAMLGAALAWRDSTRRFAKLAQALAPVELTIAELPQIRETLFHATGLMCAVEEESVLASDEIRESAAELRRALAGWGVDR